MPRVELYHEQYQPGFFPILIIVFPIMPWFYKYSVDIYQNDDQEEPSIAFGYALNANTKFKLSEIESVEIYQKVSLRDFGGYGLRQNFTTKGYITSNAPALCLTLKDPKRLKYAFTTYHPNEIYKILIENGVKETDVGNEKLLE